MHDDHQHDDAMDDDAMDTTDAVDDAAMDTDPADAAPVNTADDDTDTTDDDAADEKPEARRSRIDDRDVRTMERGELEGLANSLRRENGDLRRESAKRRRQLREAEAAAAANVEPDALRAVRAEAYEAAGNVAEHAVLRAEAVKRGANDKQAQAIAVLSAAQMVREGLDPRRSDYMETLAAVCEAAVAQTMDDLPGLAGAPTAPAPTIAQGVRSEGIAAPQTGDQWLRGVIGQGMGG